MEVSFLDYKTVKETALEWGVTERWIIFYLNDGRIPGAMKKGNMWLIPKDAAKPADGRANNRRWNTAPKQPEKEDV